MNDIYQDAPAKGDHEEAPRQRQELVLAPSRLPMSKAIAKEFEIDPTQWRVLVEQTFPSAKTIEAVLMALSYCRARNLDIFKKPVHIVPMWSSELGRMVETVWPGIAEIRTTAARTGEYAGIDEVRWGPMIERKFTGTVGKGQRQETVTKTIKFPEWASVVVYRIVKGAKCAFHSKVFWEETYATIGKSDVPNDMWGKRPRGQLDKCVESAGLRKAFPEEVGSMYAAEEMEGRVIEGTAVVPAEVVTPPSKVEPPDISIDEPDPSTDRKGSGEGDKPDLAAADQSDSATTPPADQTGAGGETRASAAGVTIISGTSTEDETRDTFVPEGEITPEVQEELDVLTVRLARATSDEQIEEVFDAYGVQDRFAGNTLAIGKAFQLKDDRINALATADREALEKAGQGRLM